MYRKVILYSEIWLFGLFILFNTASLFAQSSANKKDPMAEARKEMFLVRSGLLEKPDLMMQDWLFHQIDLKQIEWNDRFEKLKSPEEVEAYQRARIDFFFSRLGTMWSKTPLNAQVTGTLIRDGYRVEKILFESVPGFYVTGTMFLPLKEKYQPPYPGVLVPCGHSFDGKGSDFYQRACILGATHGLAMFIIDPIDQGERFQHLKENDKPYLATVPAHNVVGGGSMLLGRNTATFEIWDMIRSLDYLQSRPDIIPDKLGVTGNSGGGTQTAYIMALDPRVRAAAPACYICNLFDTLTHVSGPQDAEQNIFGQLEFGMDHADYAIMRAPQPTLLCTATKDMFNIDDAWKSFRFAKRIYSRLGYAERMSLVETDTPHGFYPQLREGAIRWMLRWLADRDEVVRDDPKVTVLNSDEIRSISQVSVHQIPNARSTYDLNRDLANTFLEKRKEIWKNMTANRAAEIVRSVAGIHPLEKIPEVKLVKKSDSGEDLVFETEPGIFVMVRVNLSAASDSIQLIVSDQGRHSKFTQQLFEEKKDSLAAVELRGWGETRQPFGRTYYLHDWFGTDGSDFYLAYLLGKSYIGMRADDLLAVARYFKETYKRKIGLIAEGYAASVALHALIAEPDLFDSLSLDPNDLKSWHSIVMNSPMPIQLTDSIHGVLNYYDTNDLLNFAGDRVTKRGTR